MNHPLLHRVWRIAVTLGPLVAIALTVAAGRRWVWTSRDARPEIAATDIANSITGHRWPV